MTSPTRPGPTTRIGRRVTGLVPVVLFYVAVGACAAGFPNPIAKLKPLYRQTPVVVGGQARAVIFVPDTDAGRQAGARIAERVKAVSGAALPVTSDAARADLKTTHVIALGNLLDNAVIERLYWNRYSFADKLYPGPGDFTLRSVCNPYPWTAGRNAFLVEASDDEGLLAGAAALAKRIGQGKDVVLPWTLFRNSYKPPTREQRATWRKKLKPTIGFYAFNRSVRSYLQTPDPTRIDEAKLILDGMCDVFEKDPRHHLTWPDETTSEWIMLCWDAVEECDEFTDAERLRYTNLLLTQVRSQPQHIFEYRRLEKATSITWNHITFPLMGLHFSSRYFRAYYPDVDRERMAVFAKKVDAVFKGQDTCWKPREDSAGYISITPRHVMTFCLAENRRTWIEKGFPLDFAMHLMATGDPMGYTAGHGDHPRAKSPSDELRGLPLPFYLTRDGRLLWRLNQLSGGQWPNPYWRDVEPVPPTDMVGLYVDPMHPEYYRWSDNLGVYGTPAAPHNVPLERSFDKLTMRTGLSPEAQYLILDGFGRGFHLHYDTNMIIKYTHAGEVLLMDSDYLVRNTTEHNGLSVVRDGRALSLVPTLASLDAKANLPGCLMARTSVFDYNGVDWHRSILMVKGGPVAVFDEAVAKQAGDYTFWCVWKTLDEGRERIVTPRAYHMLRPGTERLPTPGFTIVKTPRARGGEAVCFAAQRAAVQFDLKLPPGKHTIRMRGYGTHGGNDSLWLRADGKAGRIGFHFPKKTFAEAMGTWDLTEPAPKVQVPSQGSYRFRITLREAPGLVLDTIHVLDASGKTIFDRRAIDVVAPDGKRLRIPDHHFYVASSDGPTLELSPRVDANDQAVQRLRQIVNVRLAKGRSIVYQNLLASRFGKPEVPELRRIGDRAFFARVGGEQYLFGVGDPDRPQAVGQLRVGARAFVLTGKKLWLMHGRSVVVAGKAIHRSAKPESREIEWTGPSVARLVGEPGAVGPESAKPAIEAGPARVQPVWTFRPDVPLYRAGPEFLETADLDGDGRDEVLYGAGDTLHVLSTKGRLIWTFAAKDRVRSCAVADVDKDGSPDVLLGSNDHHVYVLSAKGAKVRSWPCEVTLVSGQGHGRYPYVTALAAADVDADGKVEVLVGTRNCWLVGYTAEGRELWKHSRQYHGVRRILIADLSGDGKPEISAANRYGGVRVYNGSGRVVWSTVSELGDVSMAIGRMKPNAKPTLVNGSSTGALTGRLFGQWKNDFAFHNYGFGINEVVCADVNGDGLDELLVASETGYVYCLDGTGKEVWRVLLGSVVRDVAAADMDGNGTLEVICGVADGTTKVLSSKGELIGTTKGPSSVVLVGACRGAGRAMGLSASRDGQLHALAVKAR